MTHLKPTLKTGQWLRKPLLVSSFAIAGLFSLNASAHDLTPGASAKVLIKNGQLHTVSQGVMANTDLLIENGKIAAIGKGISASENTQVIDATGKQIYPGLIALSSSLGMVEIGAVRSTVDTAEVGSNTPEVVAHIAFNADSEVIPTVRANGITHVEIAPGGRGLMGQSSVMQLDGWNWQDSLVKPSVAMHMTWPRAGINKSWWEKRTPEKQREDAQKAMAQLEENFATIKAYAAAREKDANTAIDLRWEAMRDVVNGKKPLFIHADDYREIEQAIAFANKQQLKIVLVGASDAEKAQASIKRHQIPVIFDKAWGQPLSTDHTVDSSYSIPARMEALGIPYALTVAGSWNSRDLPFAVGQSMAYGVSKATALASVTLEPAKILGLEQQMGSLDVGKQANIIISSGDLFDHLTHKVEYLFIEGRAVDLDNRHKRLYDKYSKK